MRPRVLILACLAAVVAAGLLVTPGARASVARAARDAPWASNQPVPPVHQAAQQAPPSTTMRAPVKPLAIPDTTFFGWALLDRRTGTVTGSANRSSATNSTESMIKPWIVADYLRALGDQQPDSGTLAELTAMIVHSDDAAAEKYYRLGGTDAVIQRMISTCRLSGSTVYPGWWSRTQMTPQDAVLLGRCLADGTAAGPAWTGWLRDTMREVTGGVGDQQQTTGGGRWGIIDGLPAAMAAGTAIKNGWTAIGSDGQWHVNCLAIQADWVLAVMLRYPVTRGLQYGAGICRSVAQQLLFTPNL